MAHTLKFFEFNANLEKIEGEAPGWLKQLGSQHLQTVKANTKKRPQPYARVGHLASPSKKPSLSSSGLDVSSSSQDSAKAVQQPGPRRGGLALLWPRAGGVEITSYSTHHIEVVLTDDNMDMWRFVGFYGHHKVTNRKNSWNLMRIVNSLSNVPTLFMGDFNEVLSGDEHVSQRRQRPAWQMDNFRQVVTDCGLFDVQYVGFHYTWCNSFKSPNSTKPRLDRGLASKSWMDRFPQAKLTHLSINTSDHLPIFLSIGDQTLGWCLYESSREVVQKAWDKSRKLDPGIRVFDGIRNSILELLKWKRDTLGMVHTSMKEKQDQLDVLQEGYINLALKEMAKVIAKDIDKLREADEIYWSQQLSRLTWRVKGDRNTGFFHDVSAKKGKFNLITALQDHLGVWHRDPTQIQHIAVQFYKELFTSQSGVTLVDLSHV
ncbi:hypothetical protein LIER_00536 [Lithospermum erythrorhizon]|uniref:Endonuclease/exonuclease/phosphatase domain-containing protein n=1 Tax=Lithospermum erythrorhizon TaxID=34254 RepID=A0AAV3NIU3_LITER